MKLEGAVPGHFAVTLAGAGAAALLLGACTVAHYGAAEAPLARARDQASDGAAVFEKACASCHGSRGEGRGAVPSIMGLGALERHPEAASTGPSYDPSAGLPAKTGAEVAPAPEQGRPEFVMAASLYTYLAYHMPKIDRGEMSEQDYWAVVNFMLLAHGSEVPPDGISEANASQVKIAVQ